MCIKKEEKMLENEAKNAQYVLEKVSQSSLGGGGI